MLKRWRSLVRTTALPVAVPLIAFAIAARIDAAPTALFVLLAFGVLVVSHVAGRDRGAGSALLGTALLDGYRAMHLPAGRSPGGATAVASMVALLACALVGALRRAPGTTGRDTEGATTTPRPPAPASAHAIPRHPGRAEHPTLVDADPPPRELVGAGSR